MMNIFLFEEIENSIDIPFRYGLMTYEIDLAKYISFNLHQC